MAAPIINRQDLDFLLYDWLGLEALLERERYAGHGRETVNAVLDLSERLAAEKFLTHYKRADQEEPELRPGGVRVLPEIKEAVRAYAEAGLLAAPFDSALGGMQLPELVHTASMAHFMAANIATSAYPMLTIGNARLIASFGTQEQIEGFARPEIEGRMLGTMCLSEPQAGSSLADIRTRALPEGQDHLGRRFRLTGNKMWISAGDHDITPNIVHLVLAKVPAEDGSLVPGTKGISIFIVPKFLPGQPGEPGERNDVAVAGLNHKMGYRGTVNCLFNLGEGAHRPAGRAGAVGWLVGEVGQGLPIMFHMMNEARIAVGLGGAMLGYRGYLLSLQYARERCQGRPLSGRGKDPSSPPIPIIEHSDIRRMMLAQKSYVEGALALVLFCARLLDEETTAADPAAREEASALLGLLTPVAKTWPSEWGLAANDLAIQIHGGYGYTRDFHVEQLYRDNRLNPIHEGTTGIQALDLLGRKILRDRGIALRRLGERISATVRRAETGAAPAGRARQLARCWARITDLCETLLTTNDDARALANATPFLSAFGHAVVGWLWLDQAIAAEGALRVAEPGRANYCNGKLRACRYFFEAELPKVDAWLGPVAAFSDTAAAMPPEQF
ncbi:MAG: acyl-CoA dehydrogenase [Acetobacteraceae bacterium]|nr:acyl-CoA dehydrogenase [Acetobacteraceae bacterium]